MTDSAKLTRRLVLQILIGAGVVASHSASVFAEDGGSSGSSGGSSGSDDGGSDDGGEPDDDFGSSASLNSLTPSDTAGVAHSGPKKKLKGKLLNQDETKKAIADGQAASLPLLLAFLNVKYPGKVLDVKLRQMDSNYMYEVKLLTNYVLLHTIVLDAKTLAKL